MGVNRSLFCHACEKIIRGTFRFLSMYVYMYESTNERRAPGPRGSESSQLSRSGGPEAQNLRNCRVLGEGAQHAGGGGREAQKPEPPGVVVVVVVVVVVAVAIFASSRLHLAQTRLWPSQPTTNNVMCQERLPAHTRLPRQQQQLLRLLYVLRPWPVRPGGP